MDAAYAYDTEGKMTSVNYPTTYSWNGTSLVPSAGPAYTYSFDAMSRPTGLTDQNNYAAVSGVVYGGACAQSNQLSSITYFGVTESRCYNNLGQMTSISIPGSINTTYAYPSGTNNGKISSQYDTISGETVTYAYDSLNRLVSAQLPGGTNLALGKTATQSSTLAGYSTDGPGSAVDGNTDGNFFDGSVTATNNDANAWWQVDLGGSRWVASMNIWNRTDGSSDRLSDYWVFVSDQPFAPSDTPATLQNRAGTWSSHQTTMPNPSSAIAVVVQGRYWGVQRWGTNYLRLVEVQVWGGWGETYGYDGFGNLVSKTPTGGAPQLSIGVNPANNQVVGQSYDANGNQSVAGVSYDAENRINSLPGILYAYDSQNERVWKGTFSGGNLISQEAYFYGVDGQKLGTYALVFNTSSPVYFSSTNTNLSVYFGGKRVAVNGVAFAQDRLGSNTQGRYFPYGEDRGTPIANDQVKFATYTRDSATGLDYADQRYYSNQFGRFLSPDPYKASAGLQDPGSWNRYAYTRNDPINRYDPSGREDDVPDRCQQDPLSCLPIPSLPINPCPACIPLPDPPPGPDLAAALDVRNRNGAECKSDVIDAMRKAWAKSTNGTSGQEAGFVLKGTLDNYTIVELPVTGQPDKITFDSSLLNGAFALFHVHPNNGIPDLSSVDKQLADQYNLDIYAESRQGLYEYDPNAKTDVQLAEFIKWATPCK
jgi:RHS repeat-associated protein